jgi:hypothetical protein
MRELAGILQQPPSAFGPYRTFAHIKNVFPRFVGYPGKPRRTDRLAESGESMESVLFVMGSAIATAMAGSGVGNRACLPPEAQMQLPFTAYSAADSLFGAVQHSTSARDWTCVVRA